jgi:Rv0078B-related antitoxin
MNTPNEFQPLMDEIYRDKVRRARAEKVPGDLSLAGFELFDFALSVTRDGVRHERPDATDEEVEAEIARRLAIKRRLDERGLYQPLP